MSVQTSTTFSFGHLRALTRAILSTPPGQSVHCPLCDRLLQSRVRIEQDGISAAVWCKTPNCLAVTQRIHRPAPL